MTELGNYLKSIREEKGMSLREAAQCIGVSHAYLHILETSYNANTQKPSTPAPDILFKIARGYNVPYDKLLEKAGHPLPANTPSNDAEILADPDFNFLQSWYEKAGPKDRETLINLLRMIDQDARAELDKRK